MSGRPAGTVTFFFSDIEGSTRRWQADPPAMQDALVRHDSLLTGAIEAAGGRVFKHTGDGFCAVFATPGEAVRAAVAAQQGLAEADWSAVGGIAVRMGLHTGQAHERGGDYFGPTLNRVARLMGVAHGGQIVVSSVTGQLLADEPVPGVELLDLGDHRLRDLAQTERISQVVADGLAREFPPLRSIDAYEHNLPRPRSSFVGRDHAVADLVERLRTARLVTLTGIGGAGKTRLAIAVAEGVLERFPGGVFFADVSGVGAPELVVPEVAGALGVQRGGGMGGSAGDLLDDMAGLLRSRRALLMLDNCEHLVEACAEVVDELLARCPELAVMATSREALSVEGEQVWRVPSLELPEGDEGDAEAVRLFSDRAVSADPTFDVAGHIPAVTEICRRLDGIPLAIELAAAQAAHLTPADIAERLDDRFQLLAGGRRRVQRQQTLEAALDWSHDLLDPPEQVLLRRLGVFGGDFALGDAEAICAGDGIPAVQPLLASLARKSLVTVDEVAGHARYRLLESVRLYAAHRLTEAGEGAPLRDRHLDHYLALVDAFPMTEQFSSLEAPARLAHDLDNLRAALDWAAVQGRSESLARLATGMVGLWWIHGRTEEGLAWLTRSYDEAVPLALRAHVQTCLSAVSMISGDLPGATEAAQRAVAMAPPGEDAVRRWALGWRAFFLQLDDPDEARRAIAELEALDPGPEDLAFAEMDRGTLAVWRGTVEEVEAAWRRAGELLAGPPVRCSFLFFCVETWRSLVLSVLGRHAEALEVSQGARRDVEEGWGEYLVSFTQAVALIGLGRRDEAIDALGTSVRIVRRHGVPLAAGDVQIGFAALALADGDAVRAAGLLALHDDQPFRTPASYVLWQDMVARVGEHVDRATRRAARAEVAGRSPDELIDEELARVRE